MEGVLAMKFTIQPARALFVRNPMLYGHFLEHFHRQIYGGVYDPGSPLSDEDGFRTDVLEALRRIKTPVIRWPGGCFVSSYHWEKGVGPVRVPSFDKAWRVEDDNRFGTDEYIKFCRKIGCEPYICTNAGTGTEEEMSSWMEYCNLESEGEYARKRIANGHPEPYRVKYWSIGNENYGGWEIGAKSSAEWSRFVLEAAKMMKHVDPTCSLSAAALDDLTDVVITSPASGEVLQHNGTSWVNAAITASGKYRQFTYIMSSGEVSFITADGQPVMALQEIE
jgi:alpha-N-arabinofuranosidase